MSEAPANVLDRVVSTTNWRVWMLGLLTLLGVGVLAAIIVLQQRTDHERDRALALQQRSFEIMLRANQLSGAVSAAEAALGRYVVSADKQLGQQYAAHWSRAAERLNRLRQASGGNPAQREQVVALQKAFEERGRELNETAAYSAFGRDRDAWGSYYRVRQSEARERVEKLLERVVDLERGILRERTEAAGNLIENSNIASRILMGFGIFIVLGAVALGWLAIEAHGQRAVADAEAIAQRERAAELQQAVDAATAQLRAEARDRAQAEAQLRQIQKMEAVGQLTGGIAHDFNNMLAVVLGGLELAKRHLHIGGPDTQRHIENAMEGANRAAALTRRLLAFSRAEPLLPEPVEAGALIDGMSDLLDRTLGDAIRVRTKDKGKGWCVWVDRHQLENALLNLAVNARDAMEGRGTLIISTGGVALSQGQVGECAAGDYVSITVSDTGCGMAADVLERVFEPFFTTKPVGKGTGLGLSQIFGFVRQSDGEIAIETAPGKGTSVTLYLPRHVGEAVANASAESTPFIADASTPSLNVLVVEDDPRVLTATVSAIEELGHRVTACDDPLAVRAVVARMEALDLIVTDVLMPGLTGPEMIAGLGDSIEGVAVLFVTGFAGEADPGAFSGHSVLRKPYTLAGLARGIAEAVENEVRRTPAAAE